MVTEHGVICALWIGLDSTDWDLLVLGSLWLVSSLVIGALLVN